MHFHAVGLNEAISSVYMARRRVIWRNTPFRRRRMRIRGPGATLYGERPRNPLPVPESDRSGQSHGKTSRSRPYSDAFRLRRSPIRIHYNTRRGSRNSHFRRPNARFLHGICLPPRGSVEIARQRENAIPHRSRTRPMARPRPSIPCNEGTPAMRVPHPMPASLAQAAWPASRPRHQATVAGPGLIASGPMAHEGPLGKWEGTGRWPLR